MGRWHELESQFPPSSSVAEAKLKEKSKEATKKKDEKKFPIYIFKDQNTSSSLGLFRCRWLSSRKWNLNLQVNDDVRERKKEK